MPKTKAKDRVSLSVSEAPSARVSSPARRVVVWKHSTVGKTVLITDDIISIEVE